MSEQAPAAPAKKDLPVAPKKVRDALHRAWLVERPESIRKADTRLKIIWGVLVLAGMGVAAVGAQTGPWWLIVVGAGAVLVGSIFIILKAQRLYRSGLMQYFYDRLDDDGVFTICAGCGYDLRGCDPPRRKCPECGKPTWNITDDNE